MNGAERVVDLLGKVLERRERDRSPLRKARVLGRYEEGTERILRTDAACVTRGDSDNHYPGTVVLSSSLAPYQRAGSGVGSSETVAAGSLWVERLEPAELPQGASLEVTVVGRGFDSATWIDFLTPAVDELVLLNQDVLVNAVSVVDSQTLVLQVDVAGSARLYASAPIAFGRQAGAVPMSISGEPREVGRKGYKAEAYSVTAPFSAPRYFAFLNASELVASIYGSDGTWIADRGSISSPALLPDAANGVLILNDSGGHVGAGALAWRSGDNELTVWDVEGAEVFTYTGSEVWLSPPVYQGGKLWWVEFPDKEIEPDTGQALLTLFSASCDLTGAAAEESVLFTALIQSWDLGPSAKVAAASSALLFTTLWRDDVNGENSGDAGARFQYGPSGATVADGSGIDLAQGLPAAGGVCVGLKIPSNTLRVLEPALGAASEARWPTSGLWALEEGPGFNAAVTANGAKALLYGFAPGGDALVLEAQTTATGGNPSVRVFVANHPELEAPPFLLFFME